MAAYTIKLILKGIDDASGPLRAGKQSVEALGDAAGKHAPKLDGFGEIVTGALRRVGEVATNAAFSAMQALAGFAAGSVATAAGFEQAMANVGAVSRATDEQLATLTETARELGATTAFSASEAAEGMRYLAMAGFSTNEVVAAMPGLLDLAAASGTDLGRTADITSNILSGFGIAASDAGRVADVLALASATANTDVVGLGEAMKYVAPVAAGLGMSLEDATTAVAKMADAGIQGSEAGTALRGSLLRLANPTEAAARTMADLGIQAFDAEGKLKPLPELAGEFARGLDGMTDQQRVAALATIVGAEAVSGFSAMLAVGEDELADFSAALSASGGTARVMAEQQLATLQGRMKTLSSAAESLQITLGNALLPALSALAVHATTVVGGLDAMAQGLVANADVVQNVVTSALLGLGTATMVYATVQLPTLAVAVGGSVAAFYAQAAAMTAALAPYALVAAAVAGVTFAVNDFNGKVETATQNLLTSKEWWNESAAAIAAYEQAQIKGNLAALALARGIEAQRAEIEADIESLGRRSAAGLIGEAGYQREMAAINAKKDALIVATESLNAEIDAANEAAAASLRASEAAGTMTDATAAQGQAASLTASDIEALGKALEATYEAGGRAVAAYVQTEAAFLDGVEQRQAEHTAEIARLEAEKRRASSAEQRAAIDEQILALQASYAEQELAQATSYAEQQAAQRAHLGHQLIEYTTNQALLGNISKETAAEITEALVTEYGIQEDASAATFLRMAQSIDNFADDAGGSIGDLVGELRTQEQAAVDAQRAMEAMEGDYIATVVANFVEAGGEAADYAESLRRIPSEVVTRVVTIREEQHVSSRSGGGMEARAGGGPVSAGTPYLVGEMGRELFVPEINGRIVTNAETERALRSGDGRGGVTYNITITNSDIRDERSLLAALRTRELLLGGA